MERQDRRTPADNSQDDIANASRDGPAHDAREIRRRDEPAAFRPLVARVRHDELPRGEGRWIVFAGARLGVVQSLAQVFRVTAKFHPNSGAGKRPSMACAASDQFSIGVNRNDPMTFASSRNQKETNDAPGRSPGEAGKPVRSHPPMAHAPTRRAAAGRRRPCAPAECATRAAR